MGHDEIADGIENFNPVPVGLVHAGKKAGIFQRDRSVAGDGLQNLVVIFRGLFAISQAQDAHQLSRSAQQPDQGALASPSSEASAAPTNSVALDETMAPSFRASACSMAWLNRRSNERS